MFNFIKSIWKKVCHSSKCLMCRHLASQFIIIKWSHAICVDLVKNWCYEGTCYEGTRASIVTIYSLLF